MQLEGIDHIAMSVSDVPRAVAWYIDVLGFEPRHQGMWEGIPVFIGKGNTAIAIFPLSSQAATSSVRSTAPQFLHLAFRTDAAGFEIAQQELKSRGISFDFRDHEISHSIYFRDPDGHPLEITTYEVPRA
jgi:catechol 2,3-dioxygenase-like lactoylglutathione lyase family enzyme